MTNCERLEPFHMEDGFGARSLVQAKRIACHRATGVVHEVNSVAIMEDKMAKGQKRSNREKKKPKADKNRAKSEPALSPFGSDRLKGNPPKGSPGKRA